MARAARGADNRGYVLLAAMAALAGSTVLSLAGLARSVTEKRLADYGVISQQAFHLAEAAVDEAIQIILTNPPAQAAAVGSYGAVVTPLPDNFYQIDAVRVRGGVTRRLRVMYSAGGGSSLPPAAVISTNSIEMIGEGGAAAVIQIEGDVIANYIGGGAPSVTLKDVQIIASSDPDNSQEGAVILADAPAEPKIYVDAGEAGRAPSCVLGIWCGVQANTSPPDPIEAAFKTGPEDPTWSTSQHSDADNKDIAILSGDGLSQPTTINGHVKRQSGAIKPPTVDVTPADFSPISAGGQTFANDCTHDFVFTENFNSLTQAGGPLGLWAGGGIARRQLPGGIYCFKSFKVGYAGGGADVPQVLFDGPAQVYVVPDGSDPMPVVLGQDALGATPELNARINHKVKVAVGGEEITKDPKDFTLFVKGAPGGAATNVDQFRSHTSGSIYAPESTVTIDASTGPDHIRGMLVGKDVVFKNQVKIRNLLDDDFFENFFDGLAFQPTVTPPGIVSWRECPPAGCAP